MSTFEVVDHLLRDDAASDRVDRAVVHSPVANYALNSVAESILCVVSISFVGTEYVIDVKSTQLEKGFSVVVMLVHHWVIDRST
jgi:hypothetical protein